jgi:hypothetical protein
MTALYRSNCQLLPWFAPVKKFNEDCPPEYIKELKSRKWMARFSSNENQFVITYLSGEKMLNRKIDVHIDGMYSVPPLDEKESSQEPKKYETIPQLLKGELVSILSKGTNFIVEENEEVWQKIIRKEVKLGEMGKVHISGGNYMMENSSTISEFHSLGHRRQGSGSTHVTLGMGGVSRATQADLAEMASSIQRLDRIITLLADKLGVDFDAEKTKEQGTFSLKRM